MTEKRKKGLVSLLAAFALVFTTIMGSAMPVQASDVTILYETPESLAAAAANTEEWIPFTIGENVGFEVMLLVDSPADTKLSLYDSAGNLVADYTTYQLGNPIQVSSAEYGDMTADYGVYGIRYSGNTLPVGSYICGITFAADTKYSVMVRQKNALSPEISMTSATITKGFSKTLSVTDGTVKKWSSNNSKIARVTSSGKVTGVKTGSTKIVATLKDGTRLSCKVTVKDNKYASKKYTLGETASGRFVLTTYSVSYDSKGNLVVKSRALNKTSYRVTGLKNLKITVKNKSGKTIGTYKAGSKKISLAAKSRKDFTFTIKKSALKIKSKQDLRNATVTIAGQYLYNY